MGQEGGGREKGSRQSQLHGKCLKTDRMVEELSEILHNGILGVAVTSSYLSPDLFHLEKPLIVTQRTVPALRALSG